MSVWNILFSLLKVVYLLFLLFTVVSTSCLVNKDVQNWRRFFEFIKPRRKAGALRDGVVFLFVYANYSFVNLVCRSPTRTCRAMARLAPQRNCAGCRERPQRCWATRTTGAPDVFSSLWKPLPVPLLIIMNGPNSEFKGTPLFDEEYLRNATRQTQSYYRTLKESDTRPVELCHRQWPWSTFKVISAIFVWK